MQIALPTPRDSDLVDMNGNLRIHIASRHYSRWCWCCLRGALTLRTTALAHLPCQPPAGSRRSINPVYYSGLMEYDSRRQVPIIPRCAASKITKRFHNQRIYEKKKVKKDIHLVDKKKKNRYPMHPTTSNFTLLSIGHAFFWLSMQRLKKLSHSQKFCLNLLKNKVFTQMYW